MSTDNFRVGWEAKVISPKFDLERGLVKPSAFKWLTKVYVEDRMARAEIAAAVPVDGREIVNWMHDCAAANAVLFSVMEAYDRLGSRLIAAAGDAYIPGTALTSDFYFSSQRGSTVASQGYGVLVTPVGSFNVPANGCTTIAKGNFLGWAAVTAIASIQWKGTLMRWLELASKPVKERVQCANIDGLVAPQFFNIPKPLALPVNTTTVKLTSNKPQRVVFTGRSPSEYSSVIFQFNVPVSAGENEVTYRVFGLPRATAHILEIQPEHGTSTIIDSIT